MSDIEVYVPITTVPERISNELKAVAETQGREVSDLVREILIREFGGQKIDRDDEHE